jgi:hypothetical protein
MCCNGKISRYNSDDILRLLQSINLKGSNNSEKYNPRILLCTPSNNAVDELTPRLVNECNTKKHEVKSDVMI